MSENEERKTAVRRADRERRARLALIDALNAVLATPHETVQALEEDIKKALEGQQ